MLQALRAVGSQSVSARPGMLGSRPTPSQTFVDDPLTSKARPCSARETRSPVARGEKGTQAASRCRRQRSRCAGPMSRKKAWIPRPGPFAFADLQHSSVQPLKRAMRTGEPARRREELIKIPMARVVDAAWRIRRAARPRKIRDAAPSRMLSREISHHPPRPAKKKTEPEPTRRVARQRQLLFTRRSDRGT